jgi:hypothetical protein
MPRFALYNTVRGLHYVSRQPDIERAVTEWIDKELKYEFEGIKIHLTQTWENAIPLNSGGGVFSTNFGLAISFDWKIEEDNMKLTVTQLCKPITCYVIMMDFISQVDGKKFASEPIGVWFERDLAEAFRESAKKESYTKLRVVPISTSGVTGLQAVIDRITAETE